MFKDGFKINERQKLDNSFVTFLEVLKGLELLKHRSKRKQVRIIRGSKDHWGLVLLLPPNLIFFKGTVSIISSITTPPHPYIF